MSDRAQDAKDIVNAFGMLGAPFVSPRQKALEEMFRAGASKELMTAIRNFVDAAIEEERNRIRAAEHYRRINVDNSCD